VGLTAWVPQGMFAELFAIGRRFTPPAPAAARSEDWGDEVVVRERFAGLAGRVDFEHRMLTWTAPSPEALEAELGETAPTFAAAREGLPRDEFEQLRRATLELIKRHNVATDGTLRIDAEYLISVARKRG
jgi:hypothetical protein